MRPLALLKYVGKAVLKYVLNLATFGVGDIAVQIADEVWSDWSRENDAAARRAELQEMLQLAAGEFRQQVEEVVREVAAGQPEEIQEQVASCLEQMPELARHSVRSEAGREGEGIPRGFQLHQSSDLVPLVSFRAGITQPQVRLKFISGACAGTVMVYGEPTILFMGRGKGCNPQLPRKGHEHVSRHHAVIEINPPDIRIRDLGSLTGTFINDTKIGQRPKGSAPGQEHASLIHDLKNGDTVKLASAGELAFCVQIMVPLGPTVDESLVKACIRCGREVATERGANRDGEFICTDCRGDYQGVMSDIMAHARDGQSAYRVIRGYSLLEELGHGGFGAVWLARQDRTQQSVAIKLMLPQVAANEKAVARFQKEISNTMSLHHRHIVRCRDQGYADGTFFMVLDYCEGGDAAQLVRQRGGRLTVDEAAEIVLQALDGLEYAHHATIPFVRQKGGGYKAGQGIVHRDLKPANLFLTGWGASRLVKIGDYGLARAFEETGLTDGTRTGDVGGTFHFMCRKQAKTFKKVGPEVDVWAMVATLYYLLTGKVPREFGGQKDARAVVMEDDPVPIRVRNPGVPVQLAELIDFALVEEPDMAFKSAAAFRAALEQVL